MTIRRQDIVLYAGGECLQRFGVPYWRTARSQDVAATISGSGGPVLGKDGVLRKASANKLRTVWLDQDGDGQRETLAILSELQQANLVDEDDLTLWSTSGTPVVTSGVDDPAGGTGAFTVEDDDGAAQEYIQRPVTFASDGVKSGAFVVHRNTPPGNNSALWLLDTTASIGRVTFSIGSWVDGEPQIIETGGTHLGSRHIGGGWWAIYWQSDAVTAANAHVVRIVPASTAGDTGSIDVYRVNVFDEPWPLGLPLDASDNPANDVIKVPYRGLVRPTTLYVKMQEWGASLQNHLDGGVAFLGGLAGVDPRLRVDSSTASSGLYRVLFDNGTAAVSAEVGSGPASYDDEVELLVHLDYNEDDAGDIRIAQSVAGGAPVTATQTGPSGGITKPYVPFADDFLWYGLHVNGAYNPIMAIKSVYGIHDWGPMRALFAYDSARAVL